MIAAVGRRPRASAPAIQARRLRQRLELAIEQVLAVLDALDADPDLEPSFAIEEMLDQRRWARSVGLGDDREWDCEDEGAQCDDEGVCGQLDPDMEPSLGATEGPGGSAGWAMPYQMVCDGEVECHDEGCDSDTEPCGFGPTGKYAEAGHDQTRMVSEPITGVIILEPVGHLPVGL